MGGREHSTRSITVTLAPPDTLLSQCNMSDQVTQSAKRPVLLIVGILLLVVGAVGAIIVKGAADRQASVDEFTAALGGRLAEITPDYTGMWVLIVVAAVGAVAAIAGFANRPRSGVDDGVAKS